MFYETLIETYLSVLLAQSTNFWIDLRSHRNYSIEDYMMRTQVHVESWCEYIIKAPVN